MSAWRKLAVACVVCSPAMFVVGSLATAIEGETGDTATPRAAQGIVLAQTLMEAPELTPEQLEAVSPEVAAEEEPEFTEEFMADPANFEIAKTVWETCGGCHGSRAYPGKAPKLKPKRYTPGFVFHQSTFGGVKMPPFGDVFTREERMAVAAWVLSKEFAP